jgi:hypothetical protein
MSATIDRRLAQRASFAFMRYGHEGALRSYCHVMCEPSLSMVNVTCLVELPTYVGDCVKENIDVPE